MTRLELILPKVLDGEIWISRINQLRKSYRDYSSLIIDFQKTTFLTPSDLVQLACLIELFHSNNCEISFINPSQSVNKHLQNIKFTQYWTAGFDRERFTPSFNKTSLCLWKVSKKMIYSYSHYASEYFSRFVMGKDMTSFHANLDEVFNNVFDHAKSPVTGYVLSQYYPATEIISFSLCDFGIGIAESLQSEYPQFESSSQLIKQSLVLGASAKSSPQNKGYGLNNLLNFSQATGGYLRIVSNYGLLVSNKNQKLYATDLTANFQGTLIRLDIDVKKLAEKDESNDVMDF